MGSLTCSAFVEKADAVTFHTAYDSRKPFAVWRPTDGLMIYFQTVETMTMLRDQLTRTIEEWRKHLEENR